MRAKAGALPAGPEWGYEMCWPGTRLLVDAGARTAIVCDAEERDVTIRYPELVTMSVDLDDALIDGIVIDIGDEPTTFVAVDILRLYGVDLRERTYRRRRETLQRFASGRSTITVSPWFDDADASATAAREHGLPGVLAKRLDSPYSPGLSADWIEHRFAGSHD